MAFIIREAALTDVVALAELHVRTFNETHGEGSNNPSVEIRERQWRPILEENAGARFCLVIESAEGNLIGFARGVPYNHPGLPEFGGELNKIYLLHAFHRQGLGRRLLGQVARRFLAEGNGSMLLFGDAHNPSNGFYEAMGAERLLDAEGRFHGGYGWRDLKRLVSRCLRE